MTSRIVSHVRASQDTQARQRFFQPPALACTPLLMGLGEGTCWVEEPSVY
jgi:hypothetical protein